MMKTKIETSISLGIGGLALVLALWASITAINNRALRTELSSQQRDIARITTLNRAYITMVELLNAAARQTNDAGILRLMETNGLAPGAPPPALITPAAPQDKEAAKAQPHNGDAK
jgi:hypothetical protein